MNVIGRDLIMQRWRVVQHDLMPELKQECGTLTRKLEKLMYIPDSVRIEEWSVQTWQGIGRRMIAARWPMPSSLLRTAPI